MSPRIGNTPIPALLTKVSIFPPKSVRASLTGEAAAQLAFSPFEPRITKQTTIGESYNPFASQGWERNATLYYIVGNTILNSINKINNVDPHEREIRCGFQKVNNVRIVITAIVINFTCWNSWAF